MNNLNGVKIFNKGKIVIQPPLQENKNKCTKCGKICVDGKKLETHISLNECSLNLNIYTCELCDMKFKEEAHLSLHHIQQHVDCDKCKRVIKNESELQKHKNICLTKKVKKMKKYPKVISNKIIKTSPDESESSEGNL